MRFFRIYSLANGEKKMYSKASNMLALANAGAGLEVLFDNRNESPGIKFNDADLLGIPIWVTVSARTLEKDSAEVKLRSKKEVELVLLAKVVAKLKNLAPG